MCLFPEAMDQALMKLIFSECFIKETWMERRLTLMVMIIRIESALIIIVLINQRAILSQSIQDFSMNLREKRYSHLGRVKEKVLPLPISLSIISWLWFLCRYSLQSIKPRPVPDSLAVPLVV